jgi:hypothetical protein
MSGESCGWASAVPAEPSNNMLLSSTHIFRMIYSTWSQYSQLDYSMWSRTKEIFTSVRPIEQNCPSSTSVVCRRVVIAVGKLRRSNPSRKSPRRELRPNQTAKQSDGHERMNDERMNVGLGPGNGAHGNV